MEIEAKFVVLAQATENRLQILQKLGSYDLQPTGLHKLHDTYFDTSDNRILASGYAYRCRIDGNLTYLTLKGLGDVRSGTLHRREELEVILQKQKGQPSNSLDEQLRAIGVQSDLYPLFTLQQRRSERSVLDRGRQVGVLSIDRIQFSGSERTVPFTELEFELSDEGTDEDLHTIVNLLRDMTALSPEPVSKFSRGLVLAVGCKMLRASGAYALCKEDAVADAARKLFHPMICKLLLYEFGAYRGEDIEALHDMRVTARRLRTAVRILMPYLKSNNASKDAAHRLAKGFKRLTKAMGPVRDLDVFRQRIESELPNVKEENAPLATSLVQAWDSAYAPARNHLIRHLERERHVDFKANLQTSLTSALTAPNAQRPIIEVIPEILEARLHAIQMWAHAAEGPDMTMKALHSLRLEIKRLRYTLEFLRPLLDSGADGAIEHLTRIQDHLGDLQDAVFAYQHWIAVESWGMWETPDQPDTLWHISRDESVPTTSSQLKAERRRLERLRAEVPELWAETAPSFTQAVTTIIETMRDKVSKSVIIIPNEENLSHS
jgi:CHAD domain-containing protein/uncharacterized protein YjbK